uniref:Uncharacterized protein n=1 Tax=Biomphalaria glabrata TaxID=6526 RepID=A0A2C9LWS3_BIOGL
MVRGLNMNWVMEFEKQIKSHSRKTSYVGSSVDLSSRPDQKKNLNQEPNKDKKSESQSFTDMKSKPKDDYPSLEPNEACKNYQKKEKEKTKKKVNKKPKNVNNPPTKAEFTWKYENEKIHSFEDFEKPIVDKLEKYFAVDTAPQKVLVDKIFHQYQSVDFLKMKIIEKKEDAPTTIIRCEILKEDNNILCPGNWQVPKNEEYLLKKVDDTLPELTEPLEDLKNALKLMHNFEIISVSCLKIFSRPN